MKYLSIMLFAFALITGPVNASNELLITGPVNASNELLSKNMLTDPELTLSWVAPTTRVDGAQLEAHEIAGYRLYSAPGDDQFSLMIDLPSNSTNIVTDYQTAVLEGTTYYVVTVYDINGMESDYSAVRGVFGYTPKPPSSPILSIR